MAELYELQSDCDDTENEITDRKAIHDSYCEQIERLRETKERLNDIIDRALDVSDSLNEGYEEFEGSWSGDSFDALRSTVDNELNPHTYEYYQRLENVIDQFDEKISELEDARNENEDILGALQDRLSDLWYDIRHWGD